MPSLQVNLLLLLLIVVSCSSQFDGGEEHSKRIIKRNGLKEDGEHVCSYRDTISKLVNVSVEQETLRTVYKRKCNWLNICHNESKIIIVKVITYQLRTKYFDRDNLYCCDGWMRGRDAPKECKQPICSISCQNGGKCVAPDTCECLDGFEGDYCQIDNNECMDPTKNNCEQTCINTDGGFRCACEEGYLLDEDGKSCNDINECERKLDPPCKCEAIDGVCNSTCVNIPGRYRCSCSSGYELTSAEKCRDINECFIYPDICDQKCLNKPGSYECVCLEGYQYNGKKCVDIDECAIKNGNCSDNCININGSYVCTCPDGFYLTKDRKTCAVIEPDMTNMVVCQSDMIGELACKNYDEKLVIISAMYGRLSAKHCQNGNYTQNLRCKGADPTRYLRAACDNQQSCVIFLNEKKIFGDPCPGIEKYLQVTYLCMK